MSIGYTDIEVAGDILLVNINGAITQAHVTPYQIGKPHYAVVRGKKFKLNRRGIHANYLYVGNYKVIGRI